MRCYLCLAAIVVLLSANICQADEARLKDLYAEYGRLQIQSEILQGRTMEVKRAIAEELQRPPAPKEPKAEPEKKG